MANAAALLIGNSRYRSLPSLANPVDDIEHLGDCFKRLGVDTYCVPDAPLRDTMSFLGQFCDVIERLPPDSSVIFYFAGHGLQRNGEIYLLPTDVDVSSEAMLRNTAVSLTALIRELCGRGDQHKFIALDACRTNHIPSPTRDASGGLAQVADQVYQTTRQTKVMFATWPGGTASDGGAKQSSPVCRALLEVFKDPARPLPLLILHATHLVSLETQDGQVPWDAGSISQMRPFLPPTISEARAPKIQTGEKQVADDLPIQGTSSVAAQIPGHLVHKLIAKDSSGRWAYYFIYVPEENEAGFVKAVETDGNIDLTDYGSVVASCFGRAPTDDVRRYLKNTYGWDI